MPLPTSSPERIELARCDDPRDAVHRAVACLSQGGIAVLPTDTTYACAASLLHPPAVERLGAMRESVETQDACLLLRSAEELTDWLPSLSQVGQRLARRSWPGPLVLLGPVAADRGLLERLEPRVVERLVRNGSVAFGSPSHPVPRAVLELTAGPILLAPALTDGRSPAWAVDALEPNPDLELILDDGPRTATARETVVRIEGDHWEVLRPGLVPENELARRTGLVVLFVCTGNTCRSPMAEALCRVVLAERMGCPPDEVAERGVMVLSAGVAAIEGFPAASHAVEILRVRGGSLADHSSRQVTPSHVRHADRIVAMTRDHRDALLQAFPEAADRVVLLHPWGEDVDDPIGSDRENYRRTAESIEEYLRHLLDDMGL